MFSQATVNVMHANGGERERLRRRKLLLFVACFTVLSDFTWNKRYNKFDQKLEKKCFDLRSPLNCYQD